MSTRKSRKCGALFPAGENKKELGFLEGFGGRKIKEGLAFWGAFFGKNKTASRKTRRPLERLRFHMLTQKAGNGLCQLEFCLSIGLAVCDKQNAAQHVALR